MATIDELGREILDQTPVAVPLEFGHNPQSLFEQHYEKFLKLQRLAQEEGMETLEEANDFSCAGAGPFDGPTDTIFVDEPDEYGLYDLTHPPAQSEDHLDHLDKAEPEKIEEISS